MELDGGMVLVMDIFSDKIYS